MNTESMEDKVEILDQDKHVGWADIKEGAWAFNLDNLNEGDHRIVGRYRGRGSTPWLFVQGASEYLEDFESLPKEPFTEFEQPWYSAIWAPQTPDNALRPKAFRNGSDAGLDGKALDLAAQRSSASGIVHDCIYTMTFHSLWKTVTFDCYVQRHLEARRWIETLNDHNDILNSFTLPHTEGLQRIVLSNGERLIRALRFNLIPSEGSSGAVRIIVDTIKVSV
ncbi:hypothetical protein [Pseudomonas sp. UBA1879]|uniref:hypothetical protein n=1 Tax=Pseudomonas sp. UBA1879 TaxID=1947305 RepID=UPI0025FBDF08|nr:hypothetical protein [Pseudomonas sp. UBA1879]